MTNPRVDDAVTSVLFVCMGNICRSPLAECVFRHKAAARGVSGRFLIDSAGTGGWHTGDPPDPRVRALLERRGIPVSGSARRVEPGDFRRFEYILCADDENRDDLLERGGPAGRVRLLLEFDPGATCREVPDPYYGGPDGFELVYRLVDSACDRLLDRFLAEVPALRPDETGSH